MHEYSATVVRVIDGDTVDVDIDLGFDCWIRKQRIRLSGIDTPESRTRDKQEKIYGLAAKKYVQGFLALNTVVTIKTVEKGKYGRYLGDFKVKGKWLCKALLDNYHAVEYSGQSKSLIKRGHLANRKLVKLND
jgi:micrococcal nuclease|tara:strand:+ start:1834 stop:2232 length:399 start_codon:yes stop_codon:yes gene_type:complete